MTITDCRVISTSCPKCTFFRVTSEDLPSILKQVLDSLRDTSWIARLNYEYLRKSYEARAAKTIKALEAKLKLGDDGRLTSDAGEYVVSITATEIIESELGYVKIPLGELRGKQKSQNPGFDFHNEDTTDCVLIFGEAKYQASSSAHLPALKQIREFIEDGKDIADLADLGDFCSSVTLDRAASNTKGFAAAFSSKSTSTERLIRIISDNEHFRFLQSYEEIILVAVDL